MVGRWSMFNRERLILSADTVLSFILLPSIAAIYPSDITFAHPSLSRGVVISIRTCSGESTV
jgi:hypothetical protein